jgi:hypothetical protein
VCVCVERAHFLLLRARNFCVSVEKSTVEHTVRNGASCVRGCVCMGERAQVWMGIGQSVLVPITICGRLILPVGWSITRPSEQGET